jgi:hypothetical protein
LRAAGHTRLRHPPDFAPAADFTTLPVQWPGWISFSCSGRTLTSALNGGLVLRPVGRLHESASSIVTAKLLCLVSRPVSGDAKTATAPLDSKANPRLKTRTAQLKQSEA